MQRRSRSQNEVEPTMGIGPMTSSLPKKCSTTELRGRAAFLIYRDRQAVSRQVGLAEFAGAVRGRGG